MKSARTKVPGNLGKLSLVTLAAIVSTFAMADDSAWYLGTSIGPSKAVIDDVRIVNGLLGGGATSASVTDDDRGNAYKIFGGYQFNQSWALEGGYFDLGKFGFTATTVPPGSLSGTIKLRGVNLDLVGTLPITQRLSGLGRIGANYTEARDKFTGTGSVHVLNSSPNARETNLKAGLGLQYAFTDSLVLRTEVERFRINDAVGNKGDVNFVSVGLIYLFNAKAPTPMARVAAPEPVYVAAPPQPMMVAQPPPLPKLPPTIQRVPVKVTFSADSLFDFDKASLKLAGQRDLDRFALDLSRITFDVISVTGHSDRVGTHAYNMTLSTHRAETVKDYLVSSAGIAANRIVTKGVNGSDPVTKLADCRGDKASRALIACLQPDRRVEVEVSGTR